MLHLFDLIAKLVGNENTSKIPIPFRRMKL